MRHKILILIILCSISKCGLCERFEMLDSTFSKNITLDQCKKSLSKFIINNTLTSTNEKINRDIDFNYKQVIYYLKNECYEFQVYLVLRNDTIILGKIEELDYFKEYKIIKSKLFKLQPKLIDAYLTKYFMFYETKVSRRNFIKQMTFIEKYGFGCGLNRGYYSESAKKTAKYVDNKNYKNLSKMLRNVAPEIKASGATGLIQLEKTGMQIKEKERQILDHYKELNFSVYTCYGCLSGPESFISVLQWEWDKPKTKRVLHRK